MQRAELLEPVEIHPAPELKHDARPRAETISCKQGTLALAIGLLIFTLGLLGGGIAGRNHARSEAKAVLQSPSTSYLTAITAHINENSDYCNDLLGRAHGAASRVRLPGPIFTKAVEDIISSALKLPIGSASHSVAAVPSETLAAGLEIHGITLRRTPPGREDAVEFTPPAARLNLPNKELKVSCNECLVSSDGLEMEEEPHIMVEGMNSTCQAYLRMLAREALQCECCALVSSAAYDTCTTEYAVVTDADALCAEIPLTAAQAASARNTRADTFILTSPYLELGDVEAFAAEAFPTQIQLPPEWVGPDSQEKASAAAAYVLSQLGAAHSQFLSTTINARWTPDGLPDVFDEYASIDVAEYKSLEDFLLELTGSVARTELLTPSANGKWPAPPLSFDVTYNIEENVLFIPDPLVAAVALLPAYGIGITVGSTLKALAPHTVYASQVHTCAGGSRDDVYSQVTSGAYQRLRSSISADVPAQSMKIGTVQWSPAALFFLAAADASGYAPNGQTFNQHTGCNTPITDGCEF